jgi:hypothetical protein
MSCKKFFNKKKPALNVQINDETIELFYGARLKDAVGKYSRTELKCILNKTKQIVDRYGHQVELDGEVSDGDDFYIREYS